MIELITVFMVLFAIIDILGSLPVIINYKNQGIKVQPLKITLIAFLILVVFLYGGEKLLGLFGVDISSFAIAGSIVIFLIAIEMILGIKLFKNEASSDVSIFPIAFPLIAGTGSITTLISLRAEYTMITITVALALNMVVVYLVLKLTTQIERILGITGLFIIKKIFGIILLAMAIKLFMSNANFCMEQ